MVERFLFWLTALIFVLVGSIHIANSSEIKEDQLSNLYFVKCVPHQAKSERLTRGVYLLDGFRFEARTPLVMQVVLNSRLAKDFRVTQFKKVNGLGMQYYELQAKAADGDQLGLNINENGATRAQLNNERLRSELLCKVGRS